MYITPQFLFPTLVQYNIHVDVCQKCRTDLNLGIHNLPKNLLYSDVSQHV